MLLSRIKICFVLLLVLGMSMPILSFADNEIQPTDADISVEMIPENPQPYDDVTINLNSYATDLNKALIVWQSGSKTVLSGIGKKSYSFKALGPNTITLFDITITPAGSVTQINKRVAINPSEVEILWEGVDSYTPPFYRGKAFITTEGTVKAVAIPNTNTIKSGSNVVYTWKAGENDNTVQSASGYSKDSYIFQNSPLDTTEKVTVNASSVNGDYNATKTIEIPIASPKILFYKKSPTEGTLWNNAITDDTLIPEDEATFVAEPYFLALKGNEDAFTYTWTINDDNVETPSRKRELTIHPASRGGYATLGLTMENLNTFYQKVVGQLKIDL